MEAEMPTLKVPDVKPVMPKTKRNYKKIISMVLVAVLLLGAGASAGYFYRDNSAKKLYKTSQAENASLKTKLAQSEKDLAAAQKATTTTTTTTATTGTACTDPTAANIDNIEASITSGNTAALEGYMATSVSVIIAASEGMGARTPAQAISDIAYINPGGTNTWNFALSAATVNSYKAGPYKQYFPTGSVIGKASDKHVVSFQFDCKGKISGVFMAASDELLL